MTKKRITFYMFFTLIIAFIIFIVSCNKIIKTEPFPTTTTILQKNTATNSNSQTFITSIDTYETTATESNTSTTTTEKLIRETGYDWIEPLTAEDVILFDGNKSGTLVIKDKGDFIYTDGERTITGKCIYYVQSGWDYKLYSFSNIVGYGQPRTIYRYKVYESNSGIYFVFYETVDVPFLPF